jgi:hypothetical protein
MLFGLAISAVYLKLILLDMPSWDFRSFTYAGDYSFRDALMRFIDFGSIVAFFGGGYALTAGWKDPDKNRSVLGFASLATLFVYLTTELNTCLGYFYPGLRPGGISILWAVFALGLIIRGLTRKSTSVRYVGLALFSIVSAKVFFVDLSQLDQLWRIVAFVVLGILLMVGSFVYLKYKDPSSVLAEPIETDEKRGE